MTGKKPPDAGPKTPNRRAETIERDAERKARLAAALRDNLRRRKSATRDEAAPAPDEPDGKA